PRTHSGQWYQLYGNVDKFEYNRMNKQTGQGAIFGQVEQAEDVIAYVSPAFGDGFRFIAAALTINDTNDTNMDAIAYRVVYKKDALNAGAGQVIVSDRFMPTGETYTRTAATVGYDFGAVTLGATYEMNDIADNANFDSFAVVAEADVADKTTLTVGYANKSHDVETNDKTGMMAKIKYQASKSTYMYLEGGQYAGEGDVEYVDNYLAGISVSF
ncbi:MAG: porin, partial [Oceanobacter sp.]